MSEEIQVTAIAVDDGFNPEDVDYSRDPNSGAMPQPGGAAASHAPVIDDGDVSFDAGVADEDTVEDVASDDNVGDEAEANDEAVQADFVANVPDPLIAADDANDDDPDGAAVQE